MSTKIEHRKPLRESAKQRMTDKEAARELFTAGYLKALDDVADALAVPKSAGFIEALRSKAANIGARAAIAKATGSAA